MQRQLIYWNLQSKWPFTTKIALIFSAFKKTSYVLALYGDTTDVMSYTERVGNLAKVMAERIIDYFFYDPEMKAMFERNLGKDFDEGVMI